MSLQLIFVVETNRKCNSDWIYIKDTIMPVNIVKARNMILYGFAKILNVFI